MLAEKDTFELEMPGASRRHQLRLEKCLGEWQLVHDTVPSTQPPFKFRLSIFDKVPQFQLLSGFGETVARLGAGHSLPAAM